MKTSRGIKELLFYIGLVVRNKGNKRENGIFSGFYMIFIQERIGLKIGVCLFNVRIN